MEAIEAVEVKAPTLIPDSELEAISATDQGLAQLRSRAAELAALGMPATKADYDEIHRTTMVAVKVRTESEKLAKRLAAPYKQQYDLIRAEGKRIGDHAAASEAMVRPLKDAYEAEQERLRVEAERAAAAKIQQRVNALLAMGATFDGTSYTIVDVVIDLIEVQAAPDVEWDELHTKAGVASWKESQRIEALKKEQEAEQQRIEAERKAEADRLAEQQRQEAEARRIEAERLEAQRKEQEAEQQRLEAERAELAAMVLRARVDALVPVGFLDRPEFRELVGERSTYNYRYIAQLSTEHFGVLLESEKQAAAEAIKKAEYDRETARQQAQLREQEHARFLIEEAARIEAEEKARIETEKFKRKADKERAARLKADKKLLTNYFSKVKADGPPIDLQNEESADLFNGFCDAFYALVVDYREKATAL